MFGVVLVRAGTNPELRYAMRSWDENVPDISNLIALGSPPHWVRAKTIRFPQLSTKYQNTTRALLQACQEKTLPKEFILLNDDFFALRLTKIPVWHRGPMLDVVANYRARGIDSNYVQGMEATARALQRDGIAEPLCYEVHAPMVVDRDLFGSLLDTYTADRSIKVLHKRSMYSNLARVGGVHVEDVKLRARPGGGDSPLVDGPVWDGTLPDLRWMSTSDQVWQAGAGQLIAAKFDTASRWEVSTVTRGSPTSPGQVRYSP